MFMLIPSKNLLHAVLMWGLGEELSPREEMVMEMLHHEKNRADWAATSALVREQRIRQQAGPN